MICKKCGLEISDDVKVCPECGEIVENEPLDIAEENVFEDSGEQADYIEQTDFAEEVDETTGEQFDAVEVDGENYEENYSEDYEELSDPADVPEEETKKFGIGKAIATAAVLVIVAFAVFAGYTEIFKQPDDFAPFIYLKETENGKNVCVNDYTGKEFTLIKNFDDGNSFSMNNNFVTGGKNIFYIDNGTLKTYTIGKTEASDISKDVLSSSVVLSADDKTVLFVKKDKDDKNVLCGYNGKKVTEITKLEKIKYATGGSPCYGFLKGTDKVWYVKLKDDTKAGELIVDGKSIAKKVCGVEYISSDAKHIVYKTADGDENQLNIIENGGKATLLAKGDAADKPVYYVETPAKGIIYMSDIKESEDGENISSMSSGTLYFKEFGKKSKAIDTEVSVYAMAKEITERTNSSYDDGALAGGNDLLIYMQKSEILMANGGTNLALPKGFSYNTASPAFSQDGSRIVYTDSNEALVFCDLKNGKWSEPVTIAKKGVVAAANNNADMIAYIVTSGEGSDSKNALNLYATAKKETFKLTDNTVSTPYFGKDGKTLYYTDNLDSEKGSAALNCSDGGAKGVVVDKEINGFTSGSAHDPIAFKLVSETEEKLDIYTVKDGKLFEIAKNVVSVFYY